MSYRVAEWMGTVWEETARERRFPGKAVKNRAVDRDATAQAQADVAAALWRDLWLRAHAPCPKCGTVRR